MASNGELLNREEFKVWLETNKDLQFAEWAGCSNSRCPIAIFLRDGKGLDCPSVGTNTCSYDATDGFVRSVDLPDWAQVFIKKLGADYGDVAFKASDALNILKALPRYAIQ